MATGTVKWFNSEKGFGFVVPDSSGPDIFVHISALGGRQTIDEGEKVSYEVGQNKGKACATNVKVIG